MRPYFALVGSVLLSLGFYLLYRRLLLFKRSSLVAGVVVSYVVRDHDGVKIYHPKVSFTAENGQPYEFVSEAGSSSRPRLEGHLVRVRYNPARPEEVLIDNFLHFWAAPFACIVLGLAGLAVLVV